jgi:heme/copper-type cytochrome/quinol oxidase subunit 1
MNASDDKDSGPSRQQRLVRLAIPFLGAALLMAGAVFLSMPVQQEEFGWFAYAPLSGQTFTGPGQLVMDARKWAGVVMAGLGLLTLAFWAGVLAGRRSRRHSR